MGVNLHHLLLLIAKIDVPLTFAAFHLFVVDMSDWGGLCLFLWRQERVLVILYQEKIKAVLFWSPLKRRCTLSAPSVLRVLFMISSRRWLRERNEWGIGKYHSRQIWYANTEGKLSEFYPKTLKNDIILRYLTSLLKNGFGFVGWTKPTHLDRPKTEVSHLAAHFLHSSVNGPLCLK